MFELLMTDIEKKNQFASMNLKTTDKAITVLA